MNVGEKHYIEVCIKDLSYPLKIGLKSRIEGEDTIASIKINAVIDKIFEREFEKKIVEIINKSEDYTGPMQLGSRLINYLDSIHAATFDISFGFPFFFEKVLSGSKSKHLIKYPCEYSMQKLSLVKYKRRYRIGVPVVVEQYLIPGVNKELFEIPAEIVVEIEGFETFFIEDIIKTVEQNLPGDSYTLTGSIKNALSLKAAENTRLSLIENIKNDLLKNDDIDRCSVEFINRKIPYTYFIRVFADAKVIQQEEHFKEEHMFI